MHANQRILCNYSLTSNNLTFGIAGLSNFFFCFGRIREEGSVRKDQGCWVKKRDAETEHQNMNNHKYAKNMKIKNTRYPPSRWSRALCPASKTSYCPPGAPKRTSQPQQSGNSCAPAAEGSVPHRGGPRKLRQKFTEEN